MLTHIGWPQWLADQPASVRWAVAAGASALVVYSFKAFTAGSKHDDDSGLCGGPIDQFLKVQGATPVGNTVASAPAKVRSGPTQGGPFDQFLKAQVQEMSSNGMPSNGGPFENFLKGPQGASTAGKQAASQHKAAALAGPKPTDVPITVLFGTEYGFSKEIAELLCKKLKDTQKYWPVLVNMADHEEGYDLSKEQAVLVVCSTQGDGVPPTEARGFCEWLFTGKAGSLSHMVYSVCALGDRSYTHFCRCGKQIDTAFQSAGAKEIAARVEVNKEDWHAVNAWLGSVLQALPNHALKAAAELGVGVSQQQAATHSAPKKWGKARPYYAKVVAVEGLCNVSGTDDKNTMRAEFDLGESGLSYLPGDALGVYPTNNPKTVSELIQVIGVDGKAPVSVPSWHYDESGAGVSYPDGTMPLSAALAKCYDLRSPKAKLFELLKDAYPQQVTANGSSDMAAASSASPTLLASLVVDDAKREAYLEPRHVADVLKEFSAVRLSLTQVLSCLRQLQPRLYSISSTMRENPKGVQITVAEVRYTALQQEREGVCSTFVSSRMELGTAVPIYIHKNPDFRLPADASTPIIMVGPGTGLAPFRSFILDRVLAQNEGASQPGPMVLYFGCRRSDQDYLYGPLLEGWAKKGSITLYTAFSRQQAEKVYVQDRLRESHGQVWQLLEAGAHFYVCGDASNMAGAVEQALLELIKQHQGKGESDAQAYLSAMSSSGRYQRDVWV